MHNDQAKRFNVYINGLILANAVGFFVGAITAFLPESIFLKWHNQHTLQQFFNGDETLYKQFNNLKNWLLAIIGATIMGFHLLAICIAHIPLRKQETWAYWAIWSGLICWFGIDTFWSLMYDAAYNVWLINLPALVMISIPLLLLKKWF